MKTRIIKILLILVSILAVPAAALFIALLITSPGKLPPLKDGQGKIIPLAVNEKGRIPIGGIRQGYFLRGENPQNPVLLFLHGGPGSPELPMIMADEKTERPEKYFTVCYWDQRGAGMTYDSDTPVDSMTVERMVEDTREMTEFLLKRYGGKKIYLAGHSWGSYLGVKTVQKYPHLYVAYIGIGQVSHQKESERIAYDYLKARATEKDDQSALKKLARFDKNGTDFPGNAYLVQARTPLMNKYGVGITHKNASLVKVAAQILFFGGYTLGDKMRYLAGMNFSLINAFGFVTSDNLFETSPALEVPVYLVQGAYDYQVSHELAQDYLAALNAPQKRFYSFENSAHSPNIEESPRFTAVLQEIIEETRERQ